MDEWGFRKDSADVRLSQPVSADTFTGHPCSALAAKFFAPGTFGVVLADPTDPEADRAIRIRHQESPLDIRRAQPR